MPPKKQGKSENEKKQGNRKKKQKKRTGGLFQTTPQKNILLRFKTSLERFLGYDCHRGPQKSRDLGATLLDVVLSHIPVGKK